MASFTARELKAIEISARTMSVLSVLGSLFIISSFLLFPFFRKPINRLVFFATWGNIMANVATIMSISAIPKDLNELTALCELQGVLIQWFMMADSLWVLCMALNVMLVFFHGYDSHQLHRLETWYLLSAYGLPSIPALTYVFLDHYGPQRIIGPATIWCWVAEEVAWMRIAFFYAPVWVFVSTTLAIYVVTGFRIFKKRAILRSFSRQSGQPPLIEANLANPFTVGNKIIVTTQIKYDIHPNGLDAWSDVEGVASGSFSSTRDLSPAISPVEEPTSGMSAEVRKSRMYWEMETSLGAQDGPHQQRGYARGGYRATVSAANRLEKSTSIPPGSPSTAPKLPNPRLKNVEGNDAAFAYLKVSFLMFVALIVVWVPSTVNRLDQYVQKNKVSSLSYGLNLASVLVLPLQGFWNAMIYISTTWPECKRAYRLIGSKFMGTAPSYQSPPLTYRKSTMMSSRETQDSDAEIPLEEMLKQGRIVYPSPVSIPDEVAETESHRKIVSP